jgi:FixJ family two-component response regulator
MAKTKRQFWVAVVDDDAGMRAGTQALLDSAGYGSWAYRSAEAFLRSRRAQSARCLILDMHLPGLSGLELYRTLRARGVITPGILITAAPDHEGRLRADALAAGMLAVLHKPFPGESLLQLVKEAAATHPPTR